MLTYDSCISDPVVIEYEPDDRYTDCLEWVRSSYPSEANDDVQEHYRWLILGLIIIKLRIRVAAARTSWKETTKVFLKTKQGRELDEVKSVLEEYFSLSDDIEQPEQIRQLMAFLHSLDFSLLPQLLNDGAAPMKPALGNACLCLFRTPEGPELLSAELASQSFIDLVEQLVDASNAEDRLFEAMRFALMLVLCLTARYGLMPRQSTCAGYLGYVLACLVSYLATSRFFENVADVLQSWGETLAQLVRDVGKYITLVGAVMVILCAGEVIEWPCEASGIIWNTMLFLEAFNLFLAYYE